MKIGIHDIPRRGLRINEHVAPDEVLLTAEDAISSEDEVHVALRLDRSGAQVRVKGRLTAVFQADCDRCADPFDYPIEAVVDAMFQPRPAHEPEHLEHEGDSLGLAYYDNDTLDLGPLIRDALLLALPMVRLCDDACQGLCSRCGENKTACTCTPLDLAAPGNPFAEFLRQRGELQ